MHKYIIMGPQGSGKGTQAKLLCRDYDLVHISVGDIFRWHAGHRTKLGSKVQRYLNQGRLVPDEMAADVVRERLEIHDWRFGFVLDGFPRNAPQSEFFLENYDIDAVIALELLEEQAIQRMQSRRLCSGCGLDYNLLQLRPNVAEVCDNCGGRLVHRLENRTPDLEGSSESRSWACHRAFSESLWRRSRRSPNAGPQASARRTAPQGRPR